MPTMPIFARGMSCFQSARTCRILLQDSADRPGVEESLPRPVLVPNWIIQAVGQESHLSDTGSQEEECEDQEGTGWQQTGCIIVVLCLTGQRPRRPVVLRARCC